MATAEVFFSAIEQSDDFTFQGTVYIAGPQGPKGADSTVPGPQGPQGPKGDSGGGSSSETEFYLIDSNGVRRKYTANLDGSLHFQTVSSGGVQTALYGTGQYNDDGSFVYA